MRYYDNDIHEWIDTPQQNGLVSWIRGLNATQLDNFRQDLNSEVAINPSVQSTHTFRISCKTVIRCQQKFRHLGKSATAASPPSIFEMIESVMFGVIIGDEFAKRIKGS